MSLRLFHGSATYPTDARPVLTIGNFDGVHYGHRALLGRVRDEAARLGVPACVYTFEPPPRRVLQPEQSPPRILNLEDKVALLGQAGIDHVVVERFDLELAAQSPEWFATEILGKHLHPTAMVVGYDFRFGRRRAGDMALLRQMLPTLPIEAIERVMYADKVASSSRVREAVASGEVALAAELLGRPYSFPGLVVRGDGRGRTIGFPTANLSFEAELLPAPGVYAVRLQVGDERLPGVANLGFRPTFGGHALTVEVHLFDFAGDLYGQRVRLEMVRRIRPEQRFSGVAALVAQIGLDVARARELLAP